MGDALCLQPWVSVSGNNRTVTQEEAQWLDIVGYRDVAIYVEVAFVPDQAGVTTLEVQSAPSRDEVLFFGTSGVLTPAPYVASWSFSSSPPLGVQTIAIKRWSDASTTTPPSRLIRWVVSFPASNTGITFRIWLSLLQTASLCPGKRLVRVESPPAPLIAAPVHPAPPLPATPASPPSTPVARIR
ncbi:MAG TPA: hypothetical protein VHK47_11440 [Polyangia bacterium]|nr:hypothetical protein [Polyangia bacterium]